MNLFQPVTRRLDAIEASLRLLVSGQASILQNQGTQMAKIDDDFAALKTAADNIVTKLTEVTAELAAANAALAANNSTALQAALDAADAKVLAITAELTPAAPAPVAPAPVAPAPVAPAPVAPAP